MDFKSYKSIENSSRKDYLEKIIAQKRTNGIFVVQEKVHGANFSIWYDGIKMTCAKRSGFISSTDNFYEHVLVFENYREKVIELHQVLNKAKKITNITVFGELFGGIYPHLDVVENKDVPIVQQGIYYSPNIEFYAYDILADEQFISVQECNKLFEEIGFFYAKTLYFGNFDDCVKYTNLFSTTIPVELNLPEIDNNICEGVIIKSQGEEYFSSFQRVVLKNKNKKWGEKARAKKIKKQIDLSETANVLLAELVSFITPNRLRNVISKIGSISKADFGKLIVGLSKDAWNDFSKDNDKMFKKLEKREQKMLTKQMNTHCSALIKENFELIIGNNF